MIARWVGQKYALAVMQRPVCQEGSAILAATGAMLWLTLD